MKSDTFHLLGTLAIGLMLAVNFYRDCQRAEMDQKQNEALMAAREAVLSQGRAIEELASFAEVVVERAKRQQSGGSTQ